jgi:hypothetical protein
MVSKPQGSSPSREPDLKKHELSDEVGGPEPSYPAGETISLQPATFGRWNGMPLLPPQGDSER